MTSLFRFLHFKRRKGSSEIIFSGFESCHNVLVNKDGDPPRAHEGFSAL